jgi:hypothetical protein
MDRDAEKADRGDEVLQGDTGMIGSESEEPGPGRDTSLTDPDPAASTDQPQATVAMSEGDPMRTRLGSHVEGAGVIGDDVAAAEEGATRDTPPAVPTAFERDPALAAEPVVDQGSYGPGVAAAGGRVEDAGPSDRSAFADEPPAPERSAFATEDAGSADRTAVAEPGVAGYEGEPGGAGMAGYREEPQRMDRPGGGGSLFTDEEPERLDRPGPQEPGVQDGVDDQEADQARRQRPSDS